MEGRQSLPRLVASIGLAAVVWMGGPAVVRGAGPASDEYLRGYAAAVLERDFGVSAESLTVHGGVVRIEGRELAGQEEGRVVGVLGAIAGVRRVEVVAEGGARAWAPESSPGAIELQEHQEADSLPETGGEATKLETGLLPGGGLLFGPLMADPRWPHFSTSLQRYTDGGLGTVWSTSFGHTLVLWRRDAPGGGQWELGMPASVFAIFDLDAESNDLLNADYWVGVENTWRWGDLAVLARLFHQSSHLGDEFLLNHPGVERVNLTYESLDLKLGYDLPVGLRVYGGGGYLFDQEPSGFDPLNVEYGLEWRCGQTVLGRHLRPVAAADVRHWEEVAWEPDLSLRGGFQLERMPERWPVIQFMLEFYDGHSPNGQFYSQEIQFIGAGVHAYY